jgi:hypothetical protein
MFGWKRKPAREPIKPITEGYQPGRLRPIGTGFKPHFGDQSEGPCDLPPPPRGGSSVMKPPNK